MCHVLPPVGLSNASSSSSTSKRTGKCRPAVVDTGAIAGETGSEVRMKRIIVLSALLLLLLGG
jgi:hypothetical protein